MYYHAYVCHVGCYVNSQGFLIATQLFAQLSHMPKRFSSCLQPTPCWVTDFCELSFDAAKSFCQGHVTLLLSGINTRESTFSLGGVASY